MPEGSVRSPLLGDGVHGVGQVVHVRAGDPRHRDTPVLATAAVSIEKYCTVQHGLNNSVADPGCLTRIQILSIPDPGSASKNLSFLTQKMVSELKEM